MADGERIRESLQGPLDAAYVKQREQAGWKLVVVEWERAAASPAIAAPSAEAAANLQDTPFGFRVSGDCEHLEQNPAEMEFLLSMMELIIQDISLVKVAEELNRKGFRTRKGAEWGPVGIFNMLPRLIELTPQIFNNEEWIERRKHLSLVY
jgi:hypothetical protein